MEIARLTGKKVMKGIITNLVVIACLGGCSRDQLRQAENVSGLVEQGNTLALVLDYGGGSPEEAKKLETRLSESVQEALYESDSALSLIPSDEFRRRVFPGLDITSVPRSAKSFTLLLKVPQIRQKIDSLRLRYLVSVKEETSSRQGSGFSAYGPAPAAGFIATYEKRTKISASIIDMKNASEKDVIDIEEQSMGIYGLMVFPFFIPAATEFDAIQRFSREIVKFITSDKK